MAIVYLQCLKCWFYFIIIGVLNAVFTLPGKGVTFPKQDDKPQENFRIKQAARKEYPSINTFI